MRILTVLGARPQFIKAAPVCKALRVAGHTEILLHTGQHYDSVLSEVFFEELGLAPPDLNLGVGSGPHGWQTARMLEGIEKAITKHRPDAVLVYGDTNSTLAGALAAAKPPVPLAHVEAGLRSFNREMPEETNRVLTDHCADLLFCPSAHGADNLRREGITEGVHVVGDTMLDTLLLFRPKAEKKSTVLRDLDLTSGAYLLATLHRSYTVDRPAKLRAVLETFLAIDEPIVVPLHPRTRARMNEFDDMPPLGGTNVRVIEPVGFLDMLALEGNARLILTDSGGVQKEAFFLGVPCITLRAETEWVETVESGWNVLAGTTRDGIVGALRDARRPREAPPPVYGEGHAAERIVAVLGEAQG